MIVPFSHHTGVHQLSIYYLRGRTGITARGKISNDSSVVGSRCHLGLHILTVIFSLIKAESIVVS